MQRSIQIPVFPYKTGLLSSAVVDKAHTKMALIVTHVTLHPPPNAIFVQVLLLNNALNAVKVST